MNRGRGYISNRGPRPSSSSNEKKRRLFDKFMKSKVANNMDSVAAVLFFEAMREYADPAILLDRLTSLEERGSECISTAIKSYMDTNTFLNDQVLPFLLHLKSSNLSIGICKRPLLELLRGMYQIPFFTDTLISKLEQRAINYFEGLLWFVLLLITEGDALEVKDIRTSAKMKNLIQALKNAINQSGDSTSQRLIDTIFNITNGSAAVPSQSTLYIDDSDHNNYRPGNRHDNDHINFRDISIIPTPDEILCDEVPYLPLRDEFEKNKNQNTAENDVLDRQFRLLREDLVEPLRSEVQQLKSPKDLKKNKNRVLRRTFNNVRCLDVKFDEKCGAYFWFSFKPPKHAPVITDEKTFDEKKDNKDKGKDSSVKKVKDFWEKSYLLKFDSLVCFLRNGTPLRFGIVCHRENVHEARVGVRLISNDYHDCVAEIGTEQPETQMIQTNTSFFAYDPILSALQKMHTIPFIEELVLFDGAQQINSTPPKHYTTGPYQNIVDYIATAHNMDIASVLGVTKTFPKLILDDSQHTAMITALKNRVALIQGPPGTGKSFIGALAAKVLYDTTQETILCVCYTNHALDQFLEQLIEIGVSDSDIVRLGSSQKVSPALSALMLRRMQQPTFTGQQRKQYGQSKVQMNITKDEAESSLRRVASNTGWRDVSQFLSEEHPDIYQQFQPEQQEHGFISVGNDNKVIDAEYLWRQWLQGSAPPPSQTITPIWHHSLEERNSLLRTWIDDMREPFIDDVSAAIKTYNKCRQQIQQLKMLSDVEIVTKKRIIGCTTTAAAKHQQLFDEAQVGVVIVEEAGEILESHILTSISNRTQHVIMIGDHQQLRPKVNVHELTVESQRGYDLNLSLFERLVLAKYPYSVLSTQHRMRESISTLVRELTYPHLKDHYSVSSYPLLLGLQDTVIFIDHKELEGLDGKAISQMGEDDGLSKFNKFEVDMVAQIVQYLYQQGYNSEQMVVLTPYLSQLRLITEELAKKYKVMLNDNDTRDLLSALGTDKLPSKLEPGKCHKKPVRVATIDNYQGEEADVVIATLVRSNNEHSIGFLKQPERVNVLLSRARHGMILIGNLETLTNATSREGKELWRKIRTLLANGGHIYNGLPTVCQKHPTVVNLICTPQEFDQKVKTGGCDLLCDQLMPCGKHNCSLTCHPGDHSKMVCKALVTSQCASGHMIEYQCNEKCPQHCKVCDELKKQEKKIQKKEQKRQRKASAKKAADELRLKKEQNELALSQNKLQDKKHELERANNHSRLKIQKNVVEKKLELLKNSSSEQLRSKEEQLELQADAEIQKFNSQLAASSSRIHLQTVTPSKPPTKKRTYKRPGVIIASDNDTTTTSQMPAVVNELQHPVTLKLEEYETGFRLLDSKDWMGAYYFFEKKTSNEALYLKQLCQIELGHNNPTPLPSPTTNLSLFVQGLLYFKSDNTHPTLIMQAAQTYYNMVDSADGALLPSTWLTIAEQMFQSNSSNALNSGLFDQLETSTTHKDSKDEWEYEKNVNHAQSQAMDQLVQMIGLEAVKKDFLALYRDIRVNKQRGIDISKKRFNMRLEGNPGTGKTTVARIYGQFLVELAAISGNAFEETSGAKLVDGGVSDLKNILKGIDKAGGGLLFVDEAYQLEPKSNSQGKAVLNYLLTEIENRVGKLVVVFAGYSKDMDDLFMFNDGLPSRFPFKFKFEDYTDKELLTIFTHLVQKSTSNLNIQFSIEGGIDGQYMQIVGRRLGEGRGYPGFGNARAVQNFWDMVQRRQTNRIALMEREGKMVDAFSFTKEDLLGPRPAQALQNSEAWIKLQNMIGLTKVKQNIEALVDMVELNYELEMQLKPKRSVALNRLFLGNPGTGKTTVAKLYGQILNDIGLLSKNEVHLKAASDFIGSVLGQSETNTNNILKAAEGCVLVIDEAYGLFTKKGSNDPYKEAVINTLVEKVQNIPGEDRCVIMLGYREQMEEMMRDSNPGLARRFSLDDAFVFDDYDKNELMQILNMKLTEKSIMATFPASLRAVEVLEMQKRKPNFGNGGAVENLISKAIASLQMRIRDMSATEKVNAALIPEDFVPTKHVPTLDEIFHDVVGCQHILDKLYEYKLSIEFERERRTGGDELFCNVEMNFLFVGPPGTGKTTIARRVGMMFESLGILQSSDVVEKSATDLQAQYVGQSGKQTRQVFEEALGKVLFIDEAYRLNPRDGGSFMEEALNEIVQLLTEEKFKNKLVVIMAGYVDDMEDLLRANRGLQRRFSQKFEFRNFSVDDSWTVLETKLKLKQFMLSTTHRQQLSRLMSDLINTENWGNGGDLDTLSKRIQTHVARNITASPKLGGVITVSDRDLEHVMQTFLNEKQIHTTKHQYNSNSMRSSLHQFKHQHELPSIQLRSSSTANKIQLHDQDIDGEDGDNRGPHTLEQGRDPNVSDDIWRELEEAKKEQQRIEEHRRLIEQKAKEAEEARIQAEKELELERKRMQEIREMEARKQAEERIIAHQEHLRRLAVEANRAALEQQRILRERAKEEKMQRELQARGNCPMGYRWLQVSDGWRCGGGSHFLLN